MGMLEKVLLKLVLREALREANFNYVVELNIAKGNKIN